MALQPDSRARTAHQRLHLRALILSLTANGADSALVAQVVSMNNNASPWPDDRLYPHEIHDWIEEDAEVQATIEADLDRRQADRSQQ